jgi:polygalacturonase
MLIPTNTAGPINAEDWYRGTRTWNSAIQAAIDYAADQGTAATVVLSPGTTIELTGPIYLRNNVRFETNRHFYVSTSSWPANTGVFHFTSCSGAGVVGPYVRFSNKQAGIAWFDGGAHKCYLRDLTWNNGRSIWFANAVGPTYINNVAHYNGTAVIGAGANASASIEDVICHGVYGYNLQAEAVDINFNVKKFVLNGFHFKGFVGEAIDIGGGNCEYITISDGIIDCNKANATGINVKLNAKNVNISNVAIVNASASLAYGILIDDSNYVNLDGCFIDHTFTRGLQVEPGAKNLSGRLRCNSPMVFYEAVNVDLDVQMDLAQVSTTVLDAAIAVAASSGPITISGRIANYIGNGVAFTTCSALTLQDLQIYNVRRGILSDRAGNKIVINNVDIAQTSLYGVVVSAINDVHVNELRVRDYGKDSATPAILFGGVTRARVYNVFVKNGPSHPLAFNSGSFVHYDNIINQSVSVNSVSVNGAVTNITAGTTITW